MSDKSLEITVLIVFIAVVLLGAWGINAYGCQARWSLSGMDSEFTLFAGCLVKTKHGWIPDDRVREVQP